MVLWFTKKSKTNSLSLAFAAQQPVGIIDLQDLQSGCGFVADEVGEEPAPLRLFACFPLVQQLSTSKGIQCGGTDGT